MIRSAGIQRAKLRQQLEWALRDEGMSFPAQTIDILLNIFRDQVEAAYDEGLMDAEPDEFHRY